MAKVVYTPDATDDLLSIWWFVYSQSQRSTIADKLVGSIHESARRYALSPDIGIPRFELADRVRCFVSASYVVFYLPIDDGIEVIQVIHGARDIPQHFRSH